MEVRVLPRSPPVTRDTRKKRLVGLGTFLRVPMLFLRIFGSHPFSLRKDPDGKTRVYFSWKSKATLYGVFSFYCFQLFVILWFKAYLSHLHDNPNLTSPSFSSVEKFCLYAFPTIHPILGVIFYISSFLGTPTLVKIILEWEVFKLEFQKTFNTEENPLTVPRVRRTRGGLIGFILVLITTYSTHNSKCSFEWFEGAEAYPFLEYVCIVFGNFAFFTAVHSFLEDLKLLELLWASISGFTSVKTEIERQCSSKASTLKPSTISLSNVQNWTWLIMKIKSQVKLTGRIMALGHFLSFLVIFSTLCMSLFMFVLTIFFSEEKTIEEIAFSKITTKKASAVCILWIIRLFAKANLAENLIQQQKDLTTFLRGIGDENLDDSVRLEVNMLVNHLEKSPPFINIEDGIPLTYSLLLHMAGQMATYLVVLFQFHYMESR